LYTSRDGAELMKYMTEPAADPIARANELRAFIGDFASHQVAMMEGVNRGVRAVLSSLDPQGYEIEKGPRFMPILDKERWRQYTERFGSLLDSDHELNSMVFGAEFAEGYAEIIYGSNDRKGRR
jgi:predicted component of type VI protein secretion system